MSRIPSRPSVPFITIPFRNTKEHFEAYLKVRERFQAEIKYRRDRQWEVVKWTASVFLAVIAGMLGLQTKLGALPPLICGLVLIATVAVLLVASISRIFHDSGVAQARHDLCKQLDGSFNLQFSDAHHKLGWKLRLLVRRILNPLRYPTTWLLHGESAADELPEASKEPIQWPKWLPALVLCYCLFLFMLAAAAITAISVVNWGGTNPTATTQSATSAETSAK